MQKFFKNIFLTEIGEGLYLTFKHLFTKEITFQYPRVKRDLPSGYRGIMSMLRYENGEERCVGCCLCEAYCPSRCIRVVPGEDKNQPLRRFAKEYYLDLTRCVFCGFCTEACPVNALAMTPEYEASCENKRDLYLDKENLLQLGDKNKIKVDSFIDAHGMGGLTELTRKYPFTILGKETEKK